jgi:hypothetical protein
VEKDSGKDRESLSNDQLNAMFAPPPYRETAPMLYQSPMITPLDWHRYLLAFPNSAMPG